ncbi:efflux RND transporter periplasmic adaptor subunit [Photobacterium nomapromontoriensis]|uniref:efflux RND transporter periplasmic adaptor subunit n=1 Tax=Photobacterium nomapromontoriensis TaxID=2910237 RepID=UPI003D1370CF
MQRITIASLLVAVILLAGCNSTNPDHSDRTQAQPQLSVNTLPLTPSTYYTVEREYVGMVQAGQQANLGVELGGKVSQILVDVGDKVKEGDPLLILDTELLKTQADELLARQAQVTAQLDLIEANLKRQQKLKTKGFSAESDLDALNSQRDALRANFRQLTASLAANQLQQKKSTIYAPYHGMISERYVSQGDVINTGAPTLTLLATTHKEAHIGVPAKQLTKLMTNTDWTLRVGTTSYPVTLLNPGVNVDTASRTVKLRFALPETAHTINGELAYLHFNDIQHQSGYWIPLSAMTDGLRGVWNVFVLRDVEDKLTIERRSIQVLHANNDHAYVTGALENNEQIVADGLHRLVPGQRVLPIKALPVHLNNSTDDAVFSVRDAMSQHLENHADNEAEL